jgi:uncharacterized protein (TIGR03437 family)
MRALVIVLIAFSTGAAHAAGTIFTTLLGDGYQSYAAAVASDAQGNTYVGGMTAAPDFPTTTGVFQPAYAGDYDAFVAKLRPDGKVVWATYLGGSGEDWATGIALDNAGNVWVCGTTNSTNFPIVNGMPGAPTGVPGVAPGVPYFAFVAKLSSDGTKLLYSTLLGGGGGGGAAGIALDSSGDAVVAVNANSATQYGIQVTKLNPQGAVQSSYFHQGGTATAMALDSSGDVYVTGCSGDLGLVFSTPQVQQAIVFKISADGSAKLWENTLGTSAQSTAWALAVDAAGAVWVGGGTSSANFPLVNPLQNTLEARPLFRTTDSGATWTPIDNLPFALPQTMVVDPTTPTTLYEATADLGIFKSLDGGATWTAASNGIAEANVLALAIDPANSQTLYAGASKVYKSTDGAQTWTAIDSPPMPGAQLVVEAQNPNNIYEVLVDTAGVGGPSNFRKSTDGGATWATIPFAGTPIFTLAADPRASGHLFAAGWLNQATPGGFGVPAFLQVLYTSVDGGANWTLAQTGYAFAQTIAVDGSTNPSTVYYGMQYKSADGGVTWTNVTPLPGAQSESESVAAIDSSGAVYASIGGGQIFVSHDHGQTWTAAGSPTAGQSIGSIVPAGSGTLFSTLGPAGFGPGTQSADGAAGFLSKFSANGSTLAYSTYLRGHQSTAVYSTAYHEPIVLYTQNWVSGIAFNSAGDAIVTGGTRATDFATVNPLQAANAGLADAFAAVISTDGSALKYSTYLGGSQDDGGLAIALDPQGNVILAGETWSGDFPITNGPVLAPGAAGAFIAKLTVPTAPVITSVVNGASFQPGIAAGSWVTIQGNNLANTARTWQLSDFTGNDLPESLSGVSVTIDGEPAFVEYISPSQINVQAPSDSAAGTVNVVVDNNGMSATAAAQLLAYAPAFFLNQGTNTAVATVIPGYIPVTSSAPAHPGDLVVLWGTGFGPTTPAAPAGVEVSGVPPTSTLPIVTVGGMQTPVISSVLTTGGAGLYQITIQLPAGLPTGAVAVQASIGGAQTQAGVSIFVGNP